MEKHVLVQIEQLSLFLQALQYVLCISSHVNLHFMSTHNYTHTHTHTPKLQYQDRPFAASRLHHWFGAGRRQRFEGPRLA